jgi:glycosyltransferase involved in cell wall biosynthesis
MEAQVKISVLIPTYNYAHYLDETIQSVLGQSFKDFELIIVDNYSTDNTEELVRKYLTDKRVFYYKNPKNLGLVGNWNQCLTYANADYIKFVCADDKIHPEMLAKFYSVMELYPNVSLLTCYKQLFDGQPWLVELPFQHVQEGKKVIYHTMTTKSWIGEPTSVMFRKSNLHLGNFKPEYILHVDWEMWNRQLTMGDCYIIPEPLAFVRAHATQNTKTSIDRACFEEYSMAKLLFEYPGFDNKSDKKQINKIIKQKAALCAKVGMYKKLPKLMKRQERATFLKALRITFDEKVFIQGLLLLWTGMRIKLLKKANSRKKKVLLPVITK